MPAHQNIGLSDAELYHLVVDSVLDYAIFVLDPSGHVATWNKGAERLKGYKADEIIGKHFSIFYPPDKIAEHFPDYELREAARTGRFEDEGWRIRKDGSRFWANVVITALHDATGKLVGFAKVTRDLTPRKNAEEQQRKLAAEAAARETTERHNEELQRLNEALRHEAQVAATQSKNAQDLALEVELSNQQLTESLAEVEESREQVLASERRMQFLVWASDTLSASLDYEANLQELARMVVPDLADWCVVDMTTETAHREQVAIAHRDPRKVRLARELQARYPQLAGNGANGAANVLRTGRPELYSVITDEMLRSSARDAQHLALLQKLQLHSAMVVPLNARGRTLGTMTLIAAESGRRFSEADLTFAMELARRAALAVDNARLHRDNVAARRAAEHAAAAKTRFLAVMSHELRTPLNAIGGYAQLMSLGIHGPTTAEQARDLDRIRQNQANLLSLVNDVLDYAKLESGRMPVDLQPVNVRHELEEVKSLILPQLEAKRLTYDYAQCGEDLTVCADPASLRQVLLNLLSNAIKFTSEGGRITTDCRRDDGRIAIRVSDTGIGIAPEHLEEIFEPFTQLDRDTSHPKEGTGLGLSISRDFARAMGGDLTVESTVGVGSTFTILLSALPAPVDP